MSITGKQLDRLPVDPIRPVGRDRQMAGSGHPDLPLGAETLACVRWIRFLQYNPAYPEVLAGLRREIDRDDAVTAFEVCAKELKHDSP